MEQSYDEMMAESLEEGLEILYDIFNIPEELQYVLETLSEDYLDYDLVKIFLKKKLVKTAIVLINKGFRVRNPNKINTEETPLHLAMKIDNEDDLFVIAVLLEKGASIYDKNYNGETAIHAAFQGKNYKAVDAVLDYISNCFFNEFSTANEDDILHFHIACIRKHLNSVKLFLDFGFDVNSYWSLDSTEFGGLNPLQYTIIYNYYSDLFIILLQHSGNLSIKNNEGFTPLHIIYYNNYKITQAFKYGNNTKFINSVDNNGVSHFHLCCSINYPNFVQVFINSGVDIDGSTFMNCPINPGFTPLHFAVKNNCTDVVRLLLQQGADCKKSDENGLTPLHLACLNCKTLCKKEIIEVLLNYNACPVAVDKAGNTPVHLVFFKLFSCPDSIEQDIFDLLMSKVPLQLSTDRDGVSLFHAACARNNINKVNDFLNSGVIINGCVASGKFSGYTSLHFAVLFNQKEVVEVLLKRNVQVNVQSSQSKVTPLHLACEFAMTKFYELNLKYNLAKSDDKSLSLVDWISNYTNQIEIIKLLILHGAEVDGQDSLGKTPLLQLCTVNEHEYSKLDISDVFKYMLADEINTRVREIIKILLSNKANVNALTNDQSSMLHLLSKNNFLKISDELIDCLITAGADVNIVDSTGLTPLHVAVESNNKDMVIILLKHKANINAQCKILRTPLKMFIDKYQPYFTEGESYSPEDLCDILLDHGSDVNIKNQYGRTVFHDALRNKNVKLIEKLLCYGADVTMIDANYYSLLNVDILDIIFAHVQKLFAIRDEPNELVRKKCIELLKYYKTNLSQIKSMRCLDIVYSDCLKELEKLKLKKIDKYNSLYSILLKNVHETAKHIRNSNLVKTLEDQNFDDNFPYYSGLLKMQFKKALIRSYVLKSANTSLTFVLGSNLPDLCCDQILQYLTNEEVVNLKSAVVATAAKNSDSNKN